jgi:hypothetical protein
VSVPVSVSVSVAVFVSLSVFSVPRNPTVCVLS